LKKKILVSGGAGYIGSHTVVALHKAGYEAIIVDNFSNSSKSVLKGLEEIIGTSPTLYEIDCNNRQAMQQVFEQEKGIEGVIHFAAFKAVGESVSEPLKYYQNNLGSLLVLLELMEKTGVKNLVFSSSCTVYGQPEKLPVTEATPTQPASSPYGRTKQMCEDILSDLEKSKSPVRSVALRYFNPIGAHESALIGELPNGVPNNLIPFVTQTAAGIRKELTVFGDNYNTPDGTCVRDYIHVMDLADAHIKAFEFLDKIKEDSFYDTINVGTGQGNTVLEVINAFEKVSGKKLNYRIGERRPGDVEKVWANVDKANKELNWQAKYDIERSLADAWRWQQKLSNN
jgi:UDP-glucose 4-epimerase